MMPPAGRGRDVARAAEDRRRPQVERVLRLAASLFGVADAALVLADPDGLRVEAAAGDGGPRAAAALAAACRLFETLAAAEPPEAGRHPGVLEDLVPGSAFVAATPILSATGRCLGAVVLMDDGRRTLLTGLQRRLLAELGDLLATVLEGAPAATASEPAADLQARADAHSDAFALFDREGRCLLRNARFDALVGHAAPATAGRGPARATLDEARGCEADWIALRLVQESPPVGVYRAALSDGTWLSVEERRGPHGRSLVARVEPRDAFGSDGEMAHLFERCPFPMFVFDRETRAVLAVNEAALALYGWDRDAFLRLDLDGIGPVAPADAPQGWTHRTRDGRVLPVAGRTIDLAHRGRPAVLVTVDRVPAGATPTEQAA